MFMLRLWMLRLCCVVFAVCFLLCAVAVCCVISCELCAVSLVLYAVCCLLCIVGWGLINLRHVKLGQVIDVKL